MIHTHAAHTHTRRKWKRTDPAPRPAPRPPHPRPSSSPTHIHVTRGFLVIKTSTSKQRRFLGNYGKALSPEAAGGLEPRRAFGREGLLGPEGGPWSQPGGGGVGAVNPVHSVCRARLSPEGPGEKKILLVLV